MRGKSFWGLLAQYSMLPLGSNGVKTRNVGCIAYGCILDEFRV